MAIYSLMQQRINRSLLCIFLLLVLLFCASCAQDRTDTGTANSPMATQPASGFGALQEFPLPQSHSSIMRPAIDAHGKLWFGEMGLNMLTSFDPVSQQFQQLKPPHGADGIMGVAIASDNSVWFAEQNANYIGHYQPTTQQYRIYPLPNLAIGIANGKKEDTTLPAAPNELALDTRGNVWFTEMNADTIGKLDSHTGKVTQYPLSARKTTQTFDPYSIVLDTSGGIWFTVATRAQLGHLDPHNGQIHFYNAPDAAAPLMELARDSAGDLWATTFNRGLLLRFSPTTQHFSSYYAPSVGTDVGGIYGLAIDTDNTIWLTMTGPGIIARFARGRFSYYRLPDGGSAPLGIAIDQVHTVWFTESGTDKIGCLHPPA